MRVAVLGAGVVGVTTAWYLRAQGHDVTLIDRQDGVALETSFANGGQISAGHAEPWAQPGVLRKLLHWLPHRDAPLLFRPHADPAQWRWMLRFLLECRPARFEDNLRQILALGVYSRLRLRELRSALGLEYEQLAHGIVHIYEDPADYARAVQITRIVRDFGYLRRPIPLEEAFAHEPALAARRAHLAGATWTPPDESGDAFQFCQQLADRCRAAGVAMRLGTPIQALRVARGAVRAVVLGAAGEELAVDACVVALGSHSARLLRSVGIRVEVYPAKGYSATVALVAPAAGPRASVTDESRKLVMTRLGARLRIAGTAEFNGYGLDLDPVRCQALVERARTLFPGAADWEGARFWTGLRPATPSNRPLIGATRIDGLFLNTGHGTLGWTEACGSAHALAALIAGRRPDLDFAFQVPGRRPGRKTDARI